MIAALMLCAAMGAGHAYEFVNKPAYAAHKHWVREGGN
jgi:hypothetical protein